MARMRELPQFVRIKRKRNQDSLQALILELPNSKRVKSEQFIFKLQRTDAEITRNEADKASPLPLLQESGTEKDKENTFIIPRVGKEESLPEQFTEMLDSILNINDPHQTLTEPRKLKRKMRSNSFKETIGSNSEELIPKSAGLDLEYVYDVYYRDKAVKETWEVSRVGYIKFQEDEDDLVKDDDDDSLLVISDDEDSNAEDFYQNDYPEDEDGGNELDGLEAETEGNAQQDDVEEELVFDQNQYEDLYQKHFGVDDESGVGKDFLQSLVEDESSEDDMVYSEDDEYKRQNFFPGEDEDELAQHRDRIFGQLEKMIERRS